MTACILSGCEYKPVEDVDYVNAVIIERSTEEPAGGGLRYSLVITGLDDDEDSLTEEGCTRWTPVHLPMLAEVIMRVMRSPSIRVMWSI